MDFFNGIDGMTIDLFFASMASDAVQCLGGECISMNNYNNTIWRAGLETLAGHIDVISCRYWFNWVKEYSFSISGVRTLVIESGVYMLPQISVSVEVDSYFECELEFSTVGEVKKSMMMLFENNMSGQLKAWGLRRLIKYGLGKSAFEKEKETKRGNSQITKILIDQNSVFYICSTITAIIVSCIVCCAADCHNVQQ